MLVWTPALCLSTDTRPAILVRFGIKIGAVPPMSGILVRLSIKIDA